MSEYVATVTIQRSALGEGDVPVVVVAGSGVIEKKYDVSIKDTAENALERALTIVRAGLDVVEETP